MPINLTITTDNVAMDNKINSASDMDKKQSTENQVLFTIKDFKVSTNKKTLLFVKDLTIYKHRLTAFIGPNGAGKSTLLHSLLSQPYGLGLTATGIIEATGCQHSQLIQQGYVAWVGQHERFEIPLTALDYALLGVSPKLMWYQTPNQQHIDKALQLLADFELEHLCKSRVSTLSGGEKQRLAIVRALMQDTEILMLDEPTNHLDIRHQRFLLGYLQKMVQQQHKTIIVVLHDLTHAHRYSDEIVLMNHGEIVAHGHPDKLMTNDILSDIYQVDIEAHKTDRGLIFI